MTNKKRATKKHTPITLFLEHVKSNNLHSVKKSIANGVNARVHDCLALRISIKKEYYDIAVALLENGIWWMCENDYSLMRSIDQALVCSIEKCEFKVAIALLNKGANADCYNNYSLYRCIEYLKTAYHFYLSYYPHVFLLIEKLLECGADLHHHNNYILKQQHIMHSKRLATIIFPYCNTEDYQYFSTEFIETNVVQIKSAKMMQQKIDLFDH